MDESVGHIPVLAEQVLALLEPKPGQTVLDATVGRGGHAALIAPYLTPGGRYIGLDVDPVNLAYCSTRLADAPIDVHLHHANFTEARSVLDELSIGRVNALLADLGIASTQLDDPGRGLSFDADGPLDMRLDPRLTTSAYDLINELAQTELADLIYTYGEERLSRKIARKIIEHRAQNPIQSTAELARLVRRAYGPGGRRLRIDPATRTFMALRIAVNGELEALDSLLADLPGLIEPDGAAAMISFHSLEDRRVKRAFVELDKQGRAKRLTRKCIQANDAQRNDNPRSRSAKLRAVRFTGDSGN